MVSVFVFFQIEGAVPVPVPNVLKVPGHRNRFFSFRLRSQIPITFRTNEAHNNIIPRNSTRTKRRKRVVGAGTSTQSRSKNILSTRLARPCRVKRRTSDELLLLHHNYYHTRTRSDGPATCVTSYASNYVLKITINNIVFFPAIITLGTHNILSSDSCNTVVRSRVLRVRFSAN